jgi:hypothetical protein
VAAYRDVGVPREQDAEVAGAFYHGSPGHQK